MKYVIVDISTGQRLHETKDVKGALKLMKQLKLCTIAPLKLFIAKSSNQILALVA